MARTPDRLEALLQSLPGEAEVLPGDKDQVLFCGLWYDDEFVRTPEGWRMTRRVETKIYQKVQ